MYGTITAYFNFAYFRSDKRASEIHKKITANPCQGRLFFYK
ncbi:hypothetical protein FACS1894111_08650 [Clostridia bacterium]|nr:hypothetical protein FACS1894111_08650 [Clostridia bacterium]